MTDLVGYPVFTCGVCGSNLLVNDAGAFVERDSTVHDHGRCRDICAAAARKLAQENSDMEAELIAERRACEILRGACGVAGNVERDRIAQWMRGVWAGDAAAEIVEKWASAIERGEHRENAPMPSGAKKPLNETRSKMKVGAMCIRRALAHLLLNEPNDVRAELRSALVYLDDQEFINKTRHAEALFHERGDCDTEGCPICDREKE